MWTMAKGQKVYLIAFMDDHSRYVVGWGLYASQSSSQVLEVLRNTYANPNQLPRSGKKRHPSRKEIRDRNNI